MFISEVKKIEAKNTKKKRKFAADRERHDDVGEEIDPEKDENTKKEKKVNALCEKCNITFSRLSAKKIHDNTYHGQYLTVFSCEFCGLGSLNAKNITTPHKTTHKETPMPVEIPWKQVENTEECK